MKCVAHSLVYIVCTHVCSTVGLCDRCRVTFILWLYTQTVNNICVMYSLHNMRAVTLGALASVPWVPGTHEFEYMGIGAPTIF